MPQIIVPLALCNTNIYIINTFDTITDGADLRKLAVKLIDCICDERTCRNEDLECPAGVSKVLDKCE